MPISDSVGCNIKSQLHKPPFFFSVAFYAVKTKYDESDSMLIRASRVVTDKVEDVVSGTMTQTDMAEALAEIHKIDPSFNVEDFVQQCKYEIIPSVLEAYMQGNELVLKDWCHEAVSTSPAFSASPSVPPVFYVSFILPPFSSLLFFHASCISLFLFPLLFSSPPPPLLPCPPPPPRGPTPSLLPLPPCPLLVTPL